jgi:hypothetical protein
MVSVRSRRIITGFLAVVAMVALGNSTWLHFDYGARMPLAPDPQSGRIQAIIANHGRVYVTPEEARKVNYAQSAALLLILMTLLGIHFTQGDPKRSSQEKGSSEKD